MNDFIAMHVFFVIASIGFVVFIGIGVWLGIHTKRLIGTLKEIADHGRVIATDARIIANDVTTEVASAKSAIAKIIHLVFKDHKKKHLKK